MSKVVIAVVGVATAALAAVGVLGVAGAAETTTTPAASTVSAPRSVSDEGVGTAPVEVVASTSAADTAYRQAMAAAISDGQGKAQFLAEKAGATLGAVQSVAEGGGYIECPSEVEYQGAQPDFGNGMPAAAGPVFAGRAAPSVRRVSRVKRRPRRRAGAKAHKAAVESCTLSTRVALVYLIG